MITCMGGCGKRLESPGMCWECVEGARILNRNAIQSAKDRLATAERERDEERAMYRAECRNQQRWRDRYRVRTACGFDKVRVMLKRQGETIAQRTRERDEANDELNLAHGALVQTNEAVKGETLSGAIYRLVGERDEARETLAVEALEQVDNARHWSFSSRLFDACEIARKALTRIRGDK